MPHLPEGLLNRTSLLPGSTPDGSPARVLLKAASAQDLSRELSLAGVEKEVLPGVRIQLKPGHAYMLIITLGSGEFYSANENADYYNERAGKVVTFPAPIGQKTMVLGNGIAENHHTFTDMGAVYRNHKTQLTHKVPPSGAIVWDRFNERMHRGELIAELPISGWETELDMHERGIPLMWSQGSGCPSDFCGACGFEFTSRKPSRCIHELQEKLCIRPDGYQNCIYCPDPIFYDISYVGANPAAKIAFGLRKLAQSEETMSLIPKMAESDPGIVYHKMYCSGRKPAAIVLDKLMQEESLVSDDMVPGIEQELLPEPMLDKDFVGTCKKIDLNELLAALLELKIMLTPTQWWRIFNPETQGEPSGVSGFLGALPTVFGQAALGHEDAFLRDTSYLPTRSAPPHVLRQLEPFVSDLAVKPSVKVIIIKRATAHVCRPKPAAKDLYLAREYARYQLESLTAPGMPLAARWCALVNKAGI